MSEGIFKCPKCGQKYLIDLSAPSTYAGYPAAFLCHRRGCDGCEYLERIWEEPVDPDDIGSRIYRNIRDSSGGD